MKPIRVVDLFCGAGGSSSGMKRAVTKLGRKLHMTVINHWQQAVETHCANHPDVEHLCDSLEEIDPQKVVPAGKLDLLWASPSCIGFSNAAGGAPRAEQTRTGAWHVHTWAEEVDIDLIIVENVREFLKWKPLRKDGRPNNRYRNGHTFDRWYQAMQDLGYTAEHRILCSADYGDPTTRERLFMVFRRGARRRPGWPKRTHHPEGTNGYQKWVAARKIIDWDVPGKSIFTRKKPLADKTIARIAAGLRKFGGAAAEPFLVMLYGTGGARSIERPVPTVTAQGQHAALCEPFVTQVNHGRKGNDDASRTRDIDRPVSTITKKNAHALIEPFVTIFKGRSVGRSVDEPLPTETGQNCHALVDPFILPYVGFYGGNAPRSVDDPVPTITAGRGGGHLIEPFLVKYNGTGKSVSVEEPIHTIPAKARFGLVEIDGQPYQLDIRFRMLLVKELAGAMGFPKDYEFQGTKADCVRQIGNAVSVGLSSALCFSNLTKEHRHAHNAT